MQQDRRLLQFLMKLNDSFSPIRANILMMNPLPNITQAYRLLHQEERHKEICITPNPTESIALAATQRRFADNFNKGYRPQLQNNHPKVYAPTSGQQIFQQPGGYRTESARGIRKSNRNNRH